MPSILFLNRVCPPDEGATGQLLSELASALAREGWEVTVVASRPSRQIPASEMQDGVRFERVNTLPFTRSSHWRRALCYVALYPALLWRALCLPRADLVVVLTDPPLLIGFGPLLGWLKNSRLIHWAQDLYPELAEETGLLKRNGFLAGALRGLSNWGLRRCDRVIAVGRCMRTRLQGRGLDPAGLRVIPNWSLQPGSWPSANDQATFRKEQGVDDRFVVMYSGNFGLAHPFAAILEAAQALAVSDPKVVFLLAGRGPRRAWVEEQIRVRRLENVRLLPWQPKEKLYACLGAADLHLATMHSELAGLVVPSKVYGILAAGRPCVFLGPDECEGARLIAENECGTVLENATGAGLAECLLGWIRDPSRVNAASGRCRELQDRVSLGFAVRQFQQLLGAVLGHSPAESANLPDRESSGLAAATTERPR
jgi:colanic acid biosynthesis glycosyl transferase WcaI